MVVNVREIVEEKKKELKDRVKSLKENNIIPKLAIIKASDDKASEVYISKKRQMCEEIGIEEAEYIFDENVSQEEIIKVIEDLNKDSNVHGILVQLPLFKHLNEKDIISKINPTKDADGLNSVNLGKLVTGEKGLLSCTPKGIMSILKSLNIDIEGKNATVIGRSILVGKPISLMLLAKGATVTICHSKTKDLKEHTKSADILVVAAGHKHLVTKDMVKEGATVIDVGINRTEEGLKGDVDTENVNSVVKYITPVPGGVGLTTVVSLIENVIEIAENK